MHHCFDTTCQHFVMPILFCIVLVAHGDYVGGAKVLDTLGEGLRLGEHEMIPSRAVMHDYGNVSSSTTWYTLAYLESCRGVKEGDKVFQVRLAWESVLQYTA
jgi:predicted naringenin-chalcone synthase